MPTLAAVIPATDRPPTLALCKEAIAAADRPPDEVVVVVDPDGAGPAEARNVGVDRAPAEVIVFVDADVLVHRDVFTRIRDAFDRDPELAAIFGSYDDRPGSPETLSVFRNLLHHHVHQLGAGRASTFWAGLGAIRRDAFLSVGGYDARRYAEASIEDIELGARLSAAGARVVLDPALQGTHLKRWRFVDMLVTDFRRRGVPWVELLLDRQASASRSALNLHVRHRASALAAVAGVAALLGRRPGVLAASAAVLAGLNARLYALLLRRRGPAGVIAGVGLHALHHLAGAAAVPVGVVLHFSRRGGRGRPLAPRISARLGSPSVPEEIRRKDASDAGADRKAGGPIRAI